MIYLDDNEKAKSTQLLGLCQGLRGRLVGEKGLRYHVVKWVCSLAYTSVSVCLI